jgi:hypothetical protein
MSTNTHTPSIYSHETTVSEDPLQTPLIDGERLQMFLEQELKERDKLLAEGFEDANKPNGFKTITPTGTKVAEKELFESRPEFLPELPPEGKELKSKLEQAFTYVRTHKDEINKNALDMVAFYNLKDKKPFFFVTPQEARMAIDHVKTCRDQGYQWQLSTAKRDAWMYSFISSSKDMPARAYGSKETKELMSLFCSPEWVIDRNSKDRKYLQKQAPSHTLVDVRIPNEQHNEEWFNLSWLNHAMAMVETMDGNVDAVIMNSITYAQVRMWGKTVYDEYTRKSIERRKLDNNVNVPAKVFTFEIYIDNSVEDHEIILATTIDTNKNNPNAKDSVKGVLFRATSYYKKGYKTVHGKSFKEILDENIEASKEHTERTERPAGPADILKCQEQARHNSEAVENIEEEIKQLEEQLNVKKAQKQLAQTANDPNLTITCG